MKTFFDITEMLPKYNVSDSNHDDVIKWKHFPRYWPFVRRIHRSPANSPHKGQWRGALMFSLICVWINDWVNNGEAGDLRRYRIHYDVTVMNEISLDYMHPYTRCMMEWRFLGGKGSQENVNKIICPDASWTKKTKKMKRNALNTGGWKKLTDGLQSLSLCSLTGTVRYKIVVFLPLPKQNNFNDHIRNSSNEFVDWCEATDSALSWS